ncbi:NUDIX domain-containing protein [Nitratiruptor tergarcus]|uniref:Predicted NTP pyrophosphohydrolase, NUDIX family n=1 Tax=Nitratiruptor tergarcus DSM 16512 TaxID=1069081 RepID=A0A1W1WQR4_9BACT|nr:NUDIX domain-containing protein [Nitratiruptor tergarcus]SMC08549.1 Predicted NTP pyrophosphohydrolase, NUDIX family [Nitratiruptor tergarcus DSM 16512]
MKRSAGILPYRIKNGVVEVYLGHFGGPFWKNKERSWGIIKGEVNPGESDLDAAKREFFEETGKEIAGEFIDLGEAKTSNKILHIFAVQKDLDTHIRSNLVTMEYKGRVLKFPEIDQATWMDIEEAKKKIVKSQEIFLQRLLTTVSA